MGRYCFDAKTTVEQATQLNIFKLKEFGLLHGYAATTLTWTWRLSGRKNSIGIIVDVRDNPYVKVNYTTTDRNTDEKTNYDYKISLTTTPCNFGGVRYWFICPLSRNGVYCGRRTGTLYLALGGNYFGCRHCSIKDWAKFIKAHLNGGRGKTSLLKTDTFQILHTPAFGGNYAPGWEVTERDWGGGRVLTHQGTNGMNFAVVWMTPKCNFAVLVTSNQGKGEVSKACDEAVWLLIKKFLLDKKGKVK